MKFISDNNPLSILVLAIIYNILHLKYFKENEKFVIFMIFKVTNDKLIKQFL